MPYSRFYRVNNTQPGEALLLSGKEWDGLTFRKELIYEDDFHKKTPTVDQHFTVDTLKLDHWCATGNRMISNGVPIPVPIKHTTDPEARRGSVVRFERGKNKNGKEALFGIIRFRDRKAAELAKSTDVSIFVPKDTVTDGKGREYVYPVRHVCLTDYPVIPGLSGFDAIAASLDSNIIHVPKKIPKLGRLAAVKSFGKHLAVGTAVGHVTAKLGERLGGKKGKIVGEIGGHLLGGHLAHKVNPSHLKLAANVVRKTMMRHPAIALTVGAFAAGEALKKGLGKPKAPKAPKPVGLMASLALSSNIATEGIKVYPTDPPNVVGRIGGRFAPNPNSKMRQQRVRGGVREHNRLANLVFRGSNNKPNPDPKFDDVVANVKNNFHELFHESASDSHKGVLHAAKHLAVAGSAAGLAVEGYKIGRAHV